MRPGSIYDQMKASGIPIDSHESDLYAKVTDESREIVREYPFKGNVRVFKSEVDGTLWYDIPFAYTPWWEKRLSREEVSS